MTRLSLVLIAVLAAAGCKKSNPTAGGGESRALRIGLFPNITHAQALVGKQEGTFEQALGKGRVDFKQFNAGPGAMEALVAGSLDVSYVGSGPAINAYIKTKQLRIIAGAVNGGAVLVTKSAKTPAELKGKRLASPQIGNTQDIALRHWLKEQGLSIGKDANSVDVTALSNPDILGMFIRGQIEGAFVPEPWGARMVAEGGGQVLVDERSLWPDGKFPSTVIVASERAIKERGEDITKFLTAHVRLTEEWKKDPAAFQEKINAGFEAVSGKRLADAALKDALSRMEPTTEVPVNALSEAAKHAKDLGYLKDENVAGIYDNQFINKAATAPAQN
jgi:NitT/TauT family transport system substrate-binding protein